jgi:hypothetical protein
MGMRITETRLRALIREIFGPAPGQGDAEQKPSEEEQEKDAQDEKASSPEKEAPEDSEPAPKHIAGIVEEDTEALDVEKWTQAVAKVESGGIYEKMNPQSFALGKYQFLPGIWWTDRTIDKNIPGDLLDRYSVKGIREFAEGEGKTQPALVAGKYLKDYTDAEKKKVFGPFMKDAALQDSYMKFYVDNFLIPHMLSLRESVPNAAYLSYNSLLSLLHFQGPQGARDWLGSGKATASEKNPAVINAPPAKYINKVKSYLDQG